MSMTIRHVDTDGRERIIEVDSISRSPEGVLTFNTTEKITSGKTYVMNKDAKTIAVYDFDKQPQHKEQK